MRNKKKFLSLLVICSFLFNASIALATTSEDTSSATSQVNSITLEGSGKVVEWTVDGNSSKGFKVVWSKNENPTYPLRSGDKYHYYTDPNKDRDELTAFSGEGTYYVRVCEYLGGACGKYSNEITVSLGDSSEETSSGSGEVNSITVSGTGKQITWTIDGYSAKGFKVVWSKNAHPTYPTRSGDQYHYYTDTNKRSDTLSAFSGNGTYYVRVCEYLGGACGLYSNEITVSLDDSSEETSEGSGEVEKITLAKKSENSVKWETDGYSAKGFKVVWSKNSNPTYPTRSGDKYLYFSDPNYSYTALTAFSGSGKYYVRVCEYLGGSCGVYSNQIEIDLTGKEVVACTMEYNPVCGADGKTYGNKCQLNAAGVAKKSYGECPKDESIKAIETKAEQLSNNQLDEILAELKALRNLVKEQQNQINHLQKLLVGVTAVTEEMQSSINSFITYGVDDNTKKLGEGERAAVMYSYKSAFGKLPEDEGELADAIKIANGRWPSKTSEEAEISAKANFAFIYKREPNMDNQQDNAAVTIMAYGLRQRAENRNLESERRGIQIFEALFNRLPTTTEDWNIMQAITYSGASR